MNTKPRQVARRISLLYGLVAGAWIVFSDKLVMGLAPDLESVNNLQLYKGLAFVVVTAVLLHALLRRALRRWEAETVRRACEDEEKLRQYLQGAPMGIFVVSAEGCCVEANPATCAMTGFSAEELRGMNLTEMVVPEHVQRCLDQYQRVKQTGHASTELRLRRKDGGDVEVSIRAAALPDGRCIAFCESLAAVRQAQAREREHHQRLSGLVESAMDAIITADQEQRVILFNPAAERIFGWRAEQVMGQPLARLLPEATRAAQRQKLRDFATGTKTSRGMATPTPVTCLRADGGEFPGEVSISKNEVEGQLYFTLILRDMTQRQEAMKAANLFRALVDNSNDAFEVIAPSTGRFLDMNEKGLADLGYRREEILAMKVSDVDPTVDATQWSRIMEQLRSGKHLVHQGLHRRKDGTTFPVEVHIRFIHLDRDYLTAVVRDVTDTKKAEVRLQLQDAALKAAANAIVITDTRGIIVWVNEAFTRLSLYSAEDAIGKTPRLLKSGRHAREFYEGMWKTILGGHVWHGEVHNRRKNGKEYTEDITITPVKDAQGKITHFIAIKQDITEKLQMQARFLRAQRLEGIGLLAGGIAHDLNNVLAPILMGAGVLRADPNSEVAREILTSMEAAAQRGADIVRQVLTFARGVEGERVALQVRHLIKDMAHIIRETFPKDISLEQDVPTDLWLVKGDTTQIHQVLLNLCVNARDAMPHGGILRIEARNQPVDEGFASMVPDAQPGNYVMLSISDTGSGMPPAVLERIFEPFFTTKERGKGTGLGLSTVMGIVRSHGGFLQVKSEIGRGSQFIVFLPTASKETVLAPERGPAQEAPAGKGELILLVEDEKQIREVAKDILTRHGYRVLVAVDGMDGTVLFTKNAEDVALVLTDVLMPFMDGAGMARAILRVNPAARILVSTGATVGGGVEAKLEELKQMGVKTLMLKPYTNSTLLREVHRALHPTADGAVAV